MLEGWLRIPFPSNGTADTAPKVLEFDGFDGRGDAWHRSGISLKLTQVRFFRLILFQLLSPYGDWITSP